MTHVTENVEAKNLTNRLFNNSRFTFVWMLLMALAVKLAWPLENALLVVWVYGTDAYFQRGIRVVQGKPTIFSNGTQAPDWPNFVIGMGFFFFVVGGLTLFMVLALRIYGRFFLKEK